MPSPDHRKAPHSPGAGILGGDADTIASMTGAVSGALLGEGAIPGCRLAAVREGTHTVERVRAPADDLFAAAGLGGGVSRAV